jgi:hypothetical protein
MSQFTFKNVYEDLLEFADSGSLRTVASADELILALGHAWLRRVVRSVQAVGILEKNGMGDETSPLIRSALEHAVAMKHLADTGDEGIERLRATHKRWAGRVDEAQTMAGGWSLLTSEVFDEIEGVPTGKSEDASFRTKFEDSEELDLYVGWLSETAMSHPSLASARPFMSEDDRKRLTLLKDPRPGGAENITERCAVAVLLAVRAMAQILGSVEWATRADEFEALMAHTFERDRA